MDIATVVYVWLSMGFASVVMRSIFIHNMRRDLMKDGYDADFDSPPLGSFLYGILLFLPVFNLWITARWIMKYDWFLAEAKRQIDDMEGI